MNVFRVKPDDMPKPVKPETMQDFVTKDRQARLPKIQRQDSLVEKQRKALKNDQ